LNDCAVAGNVATQISIATDHGAPNFFFAISFSSSAADHGGGRSRVFLQYFRKLSLVVHRLFARYQELPSQTEIL
jgi:hypothetical protein